ncbi:aliphatic sulfonate ABC transporter substrate-binding protein [Pseudogracilibacillus sp. SO30301A]|uniref:aliphatic sulfonate ABC transporter substrate-binding protein n=1 Tax=Pseudogracilibacillus sp. SO30301A TaxID=3098291 RepID=UPI00300DD27A
MFNKRRSYLLILGFLLLILVGCGTSENSEAPAEEDTSNDNAKQKINIGYQKGNTLNILRESGILEEILEENGHEVVWKEFGGGGPLLEALFTGDIDFGHASDGAAIFAQAGNKPLVYVGADYPNPEGVGILVHKSSGIKTIQDLKGKKVGASKGGNHHYLTILALKEAGMDIDDVEWVFLTDAAQGRSAFETQQIDAFATYDPFLAGTEIDLDTINIVEEQDFGYPNRTFYFANVDFNEEHPELLELILEAINESDKWANENKPDVVKLVSEALGIEEEVIERATERRNYELSKIDEDIIAAQQKQADIYFEIDLLPEKVDVSKDMPIQ